jgi:hypothetical protein
MTRKGFCNAHAMPLTWQAIDITGLICLTGRLPLGMACRVGQFLPGTSALGLEPGISPGDRGLRRAEGARTGPADL